MSTIQEDFDRIALVSPEGSIQNNFYHNFLLRHLGSRCQAALEIGCGKGEFSRRLAERSEHVLALDLSPEMIRIARNHPAHASNIEYQLVDVMNYDLPPESFDCIATIATLHHLPLREALLKMKAALKPGGILLVLDLFEPIKWHGRAARDSRAGRVNTSVREGLCDTFLNFVAMAASVSLRLISQRRLLARREVRAAWNEHARHDIYPTMKEIRDLCAEILPGAKIKKHLLWRYSVVWQKTLRH
jgi:SAM-dependent methyltransferase